MTKEEIIEMACQAFGGVIKKEERENFIAFAKLVAEKAYEEGFFAGFEASGEGFNGEYPYSDKGIDIKTDKYVLHALKEAREQE